MGAWLLPLAAGGMWLGILAEGQAGWTLSSEAAAAILVVGLLAVGAGVASGARGRSSPGRSTEGATEAEARAGSGSAAALALCLMTGFLVIGAGWSGLRAAHLRSSPLALLEGRAVLLTGALSHAPEDGALGWNAPMNVGRIELPDGESWVVHDAVWIRGNERVEGLDAGSRVEVMGLLQEAEGDFGRYLLHRGYAATVRGERITVLGRPSGPVLRAADALRSALRSSVNRVLPSREGSLVLGLALGDTSQTDPNVSEDFSASGLSHLTAVSGENVVMFVAPVLGLATWAGLGRRGRFLVGLGAVAFFVLLTRAEPSVLRAAVMSGLTMLGVFLGRPRSVPAVMGGAVLCLLAVNPGLVYAIGFQLSVAATAGMAMLARPLGERLRFLPEGLALALGTTLGAQAGVTPVLLYHFGSVPTVTIPANILAFAAVGPGMLLGLVAAALGIALRPLGVLIGALARIPLGYLLALAHRMARAPLPSVTSPGGRLWELALGLALVGAGAWWLRSGRRLPRRAMVAALVVGPVFVWVGATRAGPPSDPTFVFFDVAQGDGALIRSPGGAVVVIDAGPDPDLVATKLASLGIRRVDLVVATHPHADHVTGFPAVLARYPAALVVDPGCSSDAPYYADFVRAVRASGVPFEHPHPGAVLTVADVRLEVLAPDRCYQGSGADANNDSIVLRVTVGSSPPVLFTGDAEVPPQTVMLRDVADRLPAVVLKVPHHGGDTSLREFLAATGARVAVVSVGQPNPYGHPDPHLLSLLEELHMDVYRTDLVGDVTVVLHGDEVVVRHG